MNFAEVLTYVCVCTHIYICDARHREPVMWKNKSNVYASKRYRARGSPRHWLMIVHAVWLLVCSVAQFWPGTSRSISDEMADGAWEVTMGQGLFSVWMLLWLNF